MLVKIEVKYNDGYIFEYVSSPGKALDYLLQALRFDNHVEQIKMDEADKNSCAIGHFSKIVTEFTSSPPDGWKQKQ
jgi:hypothetical protein